MIRSGGNSTESPQKGAKVWDSKLLKACLQGDGMRSAIQSLQQSDGFVITTTMILANVSMNTKTITGL